MSARARRRRRIDLRSVSLAALIILFATRAGFAGPLEDATAAYDNGNYSIAFSLFRSLAAQGNQNAQYDLGVMYANGWGVPQDYIQVHMWLNLAATSGDADAIAARDSIANLMSSAEIAEAQKFAREWKSRQQVMPQQGPSKKSPKH